MKIFKRLSSEHYFHDVELRIGNVDNSSQGKSHFDDKNPLLGFYEGPDGAATHAFRLAEPVSGQYLTLQGVEADHILMNEVEVYQYFKV